MRQARRCLAEIGANFVFYPTDKITSTKWAARFYSDVKRLENNRAKNTIQNPYAHKTPSNMISAEWMLK